MLNNAIHPFDPVYNADSRLLILGSFPSVKSREEGFYYGHPRNRFWKMMNIILNGNAETADEKKSLLLDNHIALFDVAASCSIDGSSDASISSVVPNDIPRLIRESRIDTVIANGTTAFALYERLIKPRTGIEAIKLPSTSPANAAWSLDKLVSEWRNAIIKALSTSAGQNDIITP